MAQGLNKVMLIGRLGIPPELRYTTNGKAVLSLRLATNEQMKIQGEWQDMVEWHTVVVWGKRAEALNKILDKGSQFYVEGRLQTREWTDRNKNKRYSTEIVSQNIILLNRKNNGRREDAPPPDDSYYHGNYSGSNRYSGSDDGGDYGGGGNYVDNDGSSGHGGGGGSEFSDDDIPF